MNEATKEEFLIFVDKIGEDTEGLILYHLLFASDPSIVFGEKWNVTPIGICAKKDKFPHKSTYNNTYTFKTNINLILGQDNKCTSYLDIQDKIMACAYEDIIGYDSYPENRIVLHYGDEFSIVKEKLNVRDIEIQ